VGTALQLSRTYTHPLSLVIVSVDWVIHTIHTGISTSTSLIIINNGGKRCG